MKHHFLLLIGIIAAMVSCSKDDFIMGDWKFDHTDYYFNGEISYTSTEPYYAAELNFSNESSCIKTDKNGQRKAVAYVFNKTDGTFTIGDNTYRVKENGPNRLVLGKDYVSSNIGDLSISKLQEVFSDYYENLEYVPESGVFVEDVLERLDMVSIAHQLFYQDGKLIYIYNGCPCYIKDGSLCLCGTVPESGAIVSVHKETEDPVYGYVEYDVTHPIAYETAEIVFKK